MHSALVLECRALSQLSQDIQTANIDQIGEQTKKSTLSYNTLCTVAAQSPRIADSHVAANSIKSKTRSCGQALTGMINSSLKFQLEPSNNQTKLDLVERCRQVTESVQSILEVLSVSSASAKEAHKLANQIQQIMSDLDTDILFAQSGTLLLDGTEGEFEEAIAAIAHHSRELTEDIRSFVKSVEAGDNMRLKEACTQSGVSIADLSDSIRVAAKFVAKEGTETQLALLNAAKSVVESLSGLIQSTKAINGNFSQNKVEELKSSSTGTVLNITKLVKTVQIIREDQNKGPVELKNIVQIILTKTKVLIKSFFLPKCFFNLLGNIPHIKELDPAGIPVVEGAAEPEELIAATRPLTYAASKAVTVARTGNTSEILNVCR